MQQRFDSSQEIPHWDSLGGIFVFLRNPRNFGGAFTDIDEYHQEGHDPPTHPILFPAEPEFDQDRLDAEFNRNRQLGIEDGYIGEEDLGDEDPAVIEANYQAWAASEEGQQAWLEAEQQRQLEEKLSGDCSFFKNAPNSHEQPVQPSYASRFIPQKGALSEPKSDPEHHEAPVNLIAHSDKPSPYDVAQWLLNHSNLVYANGAIYRFDGMRYTSCKSDEFSRFIVEKCRAAVKLVGKTSFVKQVKEFLIMEPTICRDANLWTNIVAFNDCLLNLDTWTTAPHNPETFVTTRLYASFGSGKDGSCPVFQKMINEMTGGDIALQQRIWECLGYLLAPDQTGKCFILFQGVPDSGKSVVGKFLRGCFPHEDISALELNDLSGQFNMADLIGRKLCIDMDLPSNPFKARAVSNLKKLTGGDMVSTDVKFLSRSSFCSTVKFLFGTNHAVQVPKEDSAFINRIVVVPFAFSVEKQRQNHRLPELLAAERDAIVVKALTYYRELKGRNYCFAGAYQLNAVCGTDNETALDKVMNFLTKSCEVCQEEKVSTDQLYEAFVTLYGDCCGKNKFSMMLNNLCQTRRLPVQRDRYRLTSFGNPIWGFKGLKLKEEEREQF